MPVRPDRREIGIVAFVQIERDLIRLCPWKEATETSSKSRLNDSDARSGEPARKSWQGSGA